MTGILQHDNAWLEEFFDWPPHVETNGEQEEQQAEDAEWEDPRSPHKQWIENSIFFAVQDGQLENIKYLYDNPLNDPACEVIVAAAEKGHIEVIKWLYERQPECAIAAIPFAVKSSKLKLVQWLHNQMNNPKLSQTTPASPAHKQVKKHDHKMIHSMNVAAMFGFIEILQWLHEHRPNEYTTFAMDIAAENGYLEIVKWLHEHRTEGCTANAVIGAVEKGHLEIVQWLLENRKECSRALTANSMDLAAKGGHLDLVKWLHESRSEGCTVNAVDQAAAGGHFEVVKFLLENRSEGCTT